VVVWKSRVIGRVRNLVKKELCEKAVSEGKVTDRVIAMVLDVGTKVTGNISYGPQAGRSLEEI